MSRAKPTVFLSYCHDNKRDARRLHDDLVANGVIVWWDEDIVAGQKLRAAIREALKKADKFILCLSKESEARTKSGIYPEARDAIEALRSLKPDASFVIPVRLSACEIPSLDVDATTALGDLLYVDLFPPSKWDEGVRKILNSLP